MAQQKVFAVFGLGTFGFEVCRYLADQGEKVIAFDIDSKNIEKIKDLVSQALLLDSTDADSLKEAPLEDVDIAVVAMGEDIQASILTTVILKNMGIPYIIARSVTDVHTQVLKQIGANEIVNPEIEEGARLAMRLVAPDVLSTFPLTAEYSITEMYVPEFLIEKPFLKQEVIKENRLTLIAVQRMKSIVDSMGNPVKQEIMLSPDSDNVFQENDVLFLFGRGRNIQTFREL